MAYEFKQAVFTPVPEGVHLALIDQFAFIGTCTSPWGNRDEVFVRWEFPEVRTDNGEPYTLFRTYNASLSEKSNFRKVVETAINRRLTKMDKPYTFDRVAEWDIGKPVQLHVVHEEKEGKIRAKIEAVIPASGVNGAELHFAPVFYDVTEHDEDAFAKLSDWLQEKIQAAPEWNPGRKEKEPLELNDSNEHI